MRKLIGEVVAQVEAADVPLDELKARPLLRGDQGGDLIEVAMISGGKIVEADDPLIQLEQGFEQV